MSEARITKADHWFLYVDNEAAAVKSVDSLAFLTMLGGEPLTSCPYLHNYVAENTVKLQSRVIFAICFSGVGLECWDDVSESWWMWKPQTLRQCTKLVPLTHSEVELKPAFSEVVQNHRELRDGQAFYNELVTCRLPELHPLAKHNKFIGVNRNVEMRVTGIDRRTRAGVRVLSTQ